MNTNTATATNIVDDAELVAAAASLGNTINPPVTTTPPDASAAIVAQIAALMGSLDPTAARALAVSTVNSIMTHVNSDTAAMIGAGSIETAKIKAVDETAAWNAKVDAIVDAYVRTANEVAAIPETQLPADRLMVLVITAAGAVAHEVSQLRDGGAIGLIVNRGCIVASDVRPEVDTAAWAASMTAFGRKKVRAASTGTARTVTAASATKTYIMDDAGNFSEISAHDAFMALGVLHHCKPPKDPAAERCTLMIAGSQYDNTKRELIKHLAANPSITNIVIS